MKHSNSLFAISIQRCCCYMNMLNCYKTVKWILSALPFFFTSGLQHAFVLFSDSIAQPAPGRCRFERVWDFPTSILQSKVRVCKRSAAMKAPVELLSDRTVCDSRWRGFAPTSSATMHRMQTMQGKTRLSRRCAKSVQKCAEPQKMENPTRNLTILRGILVRSRELESLAL